jgi:hypothetical protein
MKFLCKHWRVTKGLVKRGDWREGLCGRTKQATRWLWTWGPSSCDDWTGHDFIQISVLESCSTLYVLWETSSESVLHSDKMELHARTKEWLCTLILCELYWRQCRYLGDFETAPLRSPLPQFYPISKPEISNILKVQPVCSFKIIS